MTRRRHLHKTVSFVCSLWIQFAKNLKGFLTTTINVKLKENNEEKHKNLQKPGQQKVKTLM